MFCASYVYLFNLRWTGFTSPQPIVGRVYPSTLAFYPSKGRVDGSLDEAVHVPCINELLFVMLILPDSGDLPKSTRIMIFSQYRDSVSEITEMLNQHRPLVKVISFIGQSCVNKSSKGFTQKEQIRVRSLRQYGLLS